MSGADRAWRASVHRALGEPARLGVVEALRLGDRTPGELGTLLGMSSNLLSHHLEVLEGAGVVARRVSEGDARRRYVTLLVDDPWASSGPSLPHGRVLFVCTRNAARSQLAVALWRAVAGGEAVSAGAQPAAAVDPEARAVASAHGLDLGPAHPRGYGEVEGDVHLVVSVCDRAHERGVPVDAPALHWSVGDPAGGSRADYEQTFEQLRRRVQRLAAAV